MRDNDGASLWDLAALGLSAFFVSWLVFSALIGSGEIFNCQPGEYCVFVGRPR